MIIDEAALTAATAEAEKLWTCYREAEEAIQETSEAKLAMDLKTRWGNQLKIVDAIKLLLTSER